MIFATICGTEHYTKGKISCRQFYVWTNLTWNDKICSKHKKKCPVLLETCCFLTWNDNGGGGGDDGDDDGVANPHFCLLVCIYVPNLKQYIFIHAFFNHKHHLTCNVLQYDLIRFDRRRYSRWIITILFVDRPPFKTRLFVDSM